MTVLKTQKRYDCIIEINPKAIVILAPTFKKKKKANK